MVNNFDFGNKDFLLILKWFAELIINLRHGIHPQAINELIQKL